MGHIVEEKTILDKSSRFVTNFFKENLPKWALYHNLDHTIETVNGCEEIGIGENLISEEKDLLKIAAWFHDIGYIYSAVDHENISSDIASKFLKDNGYPDEKIVKIAECILATKLSKNPSNILEHIIRDSDLISLGKSDFFHKNDLLKKEIELREKRSISDLAWLQRSAKFLSSHKYFTKYAELKFAPRLNKNLIELKRQIDVLSS